MTSACRRRMRRHRPRSSLIGRCSLLAGRGDRRLRDDPRDFERQPALTAVGSGLLADRVPVPAEPTPPPTYRPGNSIWQDDSADLFRDPRARKIGDVVTVKISIKDKATLDNNSKRSRDPKIELQARARPTTSTSAELATTGDGNIDAKVDSEDLDRQQGRHHAIGEHRSPGRGGRHRRVAERQPHHQRQPGSARQFRGSRAQRRRNRASARHLDRQHRRLRQDRGGANLLRWPRPHHGSPAAGRGARSSSIS